MSVKQSRRIPSTEQSAFLLYEQFQVKGTYLNSRGVGFIFDDDPRLDAALLLFTNGKACVEPRLFLRALNDLRDLARSQERM